MIQNKIVLPTTAPLHKQREAIHNRIAVITKAAYLCGVNILSFQESWGKQSIV